MSVYLLNSGGDAKTLDDVERRLRPAFPELARIAGIEDIDKPSLKSGARSIVIMVAPSAEADFAELLDRIDRYRKNFFFIAIGGEISAARYKQLIQTANADWVAESGLPQEILEIRGRVGAATREAPPARPPIVVSFVPSAGGVGNSTLAMETAIHLVNRKIAKDSRIALVDLDFESSHVCDYLDISSKFQVDELKDSPERLDDHLLGVFASRHSSGLEVFAAPRARLRARDLRVDALSSLFDRMAHRYAFILVDLPPASHAWTTPLLNASEGILVTGVNTIPGLRQIAETIQAVRAEISINVDVRAVVNRCEFGMFGGVTRADHIARVLGEERRMFVREARIATECVNIGTPMTLARPSNKTVKDIAKIADYCMGLKPALSRSA